MSLKEPRFPEPIESGLVNARRLRRRSGTEPAINEGTGRSVGDVSELPAVPVPTWIPLVLASSVSPGIGNPERVNHRLVAFQNEVKGHE